MNPPMGHRFAVCAGVCGFEFQFYCSAIKTLDKMDPSRVLKYFNSTVVRLRPQTANRTRFGAVVFQFYCSAIKTLSIPVANIIQSLFQFYCSAIKTWSPEQAQKHINQFQFYCSAIKTIIIYIYCLKLLYISILL